MLFRFNARSQRVARSLLVAAIILSVINHVVPATAVSTEHVASKDSYVNSSRSSANYGTAKMLRNKDSSPLAVSYLSFDTSGLRFPVARATLKLYAKSTTAEGLQVRNTSALWEENTITFRNAPAYAAVEAVSGSFSNGQWVDVDVTDAVNKSVSADFALTTSSGSYVDIASREVTRQAPRLVLEAGASAGAKTYFVDSVAGNDSNIGTSPEAAWQTLQKVSAAPLAPGDSVLFKRGAVWTGSLTIAQTGTAVASISLGAYGTGALPMIQGGGSCVMLTGSYISLSDIEAKGCSWAGVEVKGSSNRVQNSIMTGNVTGVAIASGATQNLISGNQIKDNNKMSVLTETPDNDDSGAFGILINGDDNEVTLNTISGSDAFSYDYGRDGGAVEIYGGQRNNVHHNRAYENDTFAELGDERAADNVFAYNLVISSLANSLFLVTRGANDGFGPVSGTSLFNNSVFLSGSQSQGFVCYAGCTSKILKMRNNIVQAVWKVGYADGPFDEDYGVFFGGAMQFTPGPNSVQADPQWVDPAAGHLHLKATSPAVDTGMQVGYVKDLDGLTVPLDGDGDGFTAPDRGVFELSR